VDVASGQILRKFGNAHFPAPLTGSVTTESARFDVSRRAYFTDDDGVLWRLSMATTKISDWTVEPIWDVFAGEGAQDGQPSSFAPVLSRDNAGNNVILVGTGSLDNTAVADTQNFVVSLTERELAIEGGRFTSQIEKNWVLPLDEGELVTGPLSLLSGAVYFGTFKVSSDNDKCNPGESRLWGVDYTAVASDGLPKARLFNDSNEEVRYLDPTANDGDPSNDGKLVVGVSVTRTPICVPGTIENNAVTGTRFVQQGQAGGGVFQINAQVSGASNSGNSNNSSIASVQKSFTPPMIREVVGFASSIE
jgi:hypothetical protein